MKLLSNLHVKGKPAVFPDRAIRRQSHYFIYRPRMYIYIYIYKYMFGQYNPPNFNVAFVGKCVSTNVTSIGTTYNITPRYEYIADVYALNTLTF